MPEIHAFRGLRYDLGHVGSLSDVVCPPYDVIGPDLQDALYKKHPCNFVRIELNRIEPGDDEADNRYIRAGRFLRDWRAQGVLFTEADPAVYVYHQEFAVAGRTYTRRAFMARMRLSRFGEGTVFPHEETMSGPKMDRYMLTAVCQANLSLIFGLYPDPHREAQDILEAAIAGQSPVEAVDHLGVAHRMWPVTDVGTIARLAAVMGPKPVFIADGHHRYETACNWRDQVYDSGFLNKNHPANFVLMTFVGMEDPGLAVLPTHRLFSGVPELTSQEFVARLGEFFSTRPAGEGPEAAATVWEDLETGGQEDAVGLYTRKDGRWTIAWPTEAGRAKMADLSKDHGPDWQSLGVAVLHRLVVQSQLGVADPPETRYVHLVEEVVEGLASGKHPLAALVMPATVDQIRAVSMAGERMPAKSTYFYPKLLSGLVINPLE